MRVANAAVGGHGLLDQIEVARWLWRDERVRAPVVLVCLTPRAMATEDRQNVHVFRGGLWGGPPTRRQLARGWLARNSSVYIVLRDAMYAIRGERDLTAGALDLYLTGDTQERRVAWLSRTVAELREALRPYTPQLVVAYLPLAVEGSIADIARRTGRTGVDPAAPRETARRVAEAAGAPFIDLSPILDRIRAEGRPISLNRDAHYNADTSLECARAIWSALDWPALVGGRSGPER